MTGLLKGENRDFCLLAELTHTRVIFASESLKKGFFFGAVRHIKLSLLANIPQLIKKLNSRDVERT